MTINKLSMHSLKFLWIVSTTLFLWHLAEPSYLHSALGFIPERPAPLIKPVTIGLILLISLFNVVLVFPLGRIKKHFNKMAHKQEDSTRELNLAKPWDAPPHNPPDAPADINCRHQALQHDNHSKFGQMLLDHEAFVELLFNSTAEAICGFDLEGSCVFANGAFLTMTGYENNAEVLGQKVHDLIHYEHPNGSPYPQDKCRVLNTPEWEDRRVYCGEELFFRKDGVSFYADCWIHPMKHRGETIGGVISIIDITSKKNLEKEAETLKVDLFQSRKFASIGEQVCCITHDFNNVLNGIRGYTELVLRTNDTPESSHKYLRHVIEATDCADNLITEIKQLSMPENQTVTPINIIFVIENVLRLIKSTIPPNIEIKKHFFSAQFLINGKQTEIFRVLLNIIKNAIKALGSLSGGLLEITVGYHDDTAGDAGDFTGSPLTRICKIEIKDNGCGMDIQTMDRIYEPYFTTNGSNGGTGLGLSIVSGIVAEYKGRIKVDSIPGSGTCFQLFFPISQSDN